MKLNIILAIFSLTFMFGCSATPLSVNLEAGAKDIVVKDTKPVGSYEVLTPVIVSNGRGCRDFGYLGTHENAMNALKNKTKELNGDYAQITSITKPHLDGGCYDNEYKIMALIYKKSDPKLNVAKNTVNNSDEEIFTKKMRELKSLLDDGVLTKDEYNTQKAKLLEQGFNTK